MAEEEKEDKVSREFLAKMSSAVSKRCRSKMLEICLRKPKDLLGPWRRDHAVLLIHRESFTYFETIHERFLRVGGHASKLEVPLLVDSEFDQLLYDVWRKERRRNLVEAERLADQAAEKWLAEKYPRLIFLDATNEFEWSLSLAKMCRGKVRKWLVDVREDPDLRVWLVLPKTCPEVLAGFPEKLEMLGDLLGV